MGKWKIVVRFGLPITQEELQNNVPKNPGFEIHVYKDQAMYVLKKIVELSQKSEG